MNTERLLAHYERVADAPDAIPRLRRFILDLAVRGNLVPQDPKDGPALVGLSRPNIASANEPFSLPPSWVWVNVSAVAETRLGKMLDKAKNKGTPQPYLRNINVRWFDFDLSDILEMRFEDSELSEFALRSGDVLICEGGEPGRAAVWDDRTSGIYFQKAIHRVRFFPAVQSTYFVKALRASADDGRLAEYLTGTGIKHFTGKGLDSYLFPLPPLAEQHRIIARVDELMALCDRLEAARAKREATRDRLAAASLDRLNAPDADTFRDDARFALDPLPALTTRPDQIKQLRQTILNLAVRGKLVPQDPDDQPAPELLKQIHRSRRCVRNFALIAEEEVENPLPPVPFNWTWTTVDQASADDENAITDGPFGSQLKTSHYISTPGFRVIRLQNIGSGDFRDEHRSFIQKAHFERLRKHHVKPGDLVVAGLVDPRVRCCEVPANIGPTLVKADCYRLAVHSRLSSRFTLHYLNSPLAQLFAAVHHHGMTLTRIGLGNFRRIPIPLPPLAEQHRIVAKVDELMALCDRLEANLVFGETTRHRLLEALLAETLAPAADVIASEAIA